MSIFHGLSAAICFGVADFFATGATRRIGVIRTLFAVQAIGIVAMIFVLGARRESVTGSLADWAEMAAISVVSLAGVLFLYRSFAIGTLSLVSPIASGFAIVTAGFALVAGERPPGLAVAGALLLVSGVVVVSSTKSNGAATVCGIPEAIGAAACFGFYFWALGELTPKLGVYWPVFVTRLVEMILAGAYLMWRPTIAMPSETRKSVALPLIAAGLFDTAALVTFNLGVDSTYTTTTTALTSLYSAVTVLLAWLLLRERLARQQWAGVAVVLAGVVLVSF
ncbi:MAG: EamA family transporter [Thermomicrobiales bacterium]